MGVPSWPAVLPQAFLLRGYAEAGRDNLVRSDTDTGPAKVRRRATAASRQASGALRLSGAQFAIFRVFVEEELADGARAFTLPAQHGEADWLVRLGPEPWQARPVSPDRWEVSLSLEILP